MSMPIAPPRLEQTTISSREFRSPGFWSIGMRSRYIANAAQPAQFVAIDLPGGFSVRLPLGIWQANGDEFSVLFQEWGERTSRLAQLPVGQPISCIGPLGNAFTVPAKGSRAIIVAGGLGVAAFWLLAKALRSAEVVTTIVLGARTKNHLIGQDALADYGFPIEFCTDDGSAGFHGNVVQRVAMLPAADILYGCGPRGMLRALCAQANNQNVRCEVSLEECFGCSLGTCWGCVVPVRRGSPQGTGYPKAASETREYDFARVCADGTVFGARDIIWQT